jgi:hypothetical protein
MNTIERLPREMLSEIFQYYGDQTKLETTVALVSKTMRSAIYGIYKNPFEQEFYCSHNVCHCENRRGKIHTTSVIIPDIIPNNIKYQPYLTKLRQMIEVKEYINKVTFYRLRTSQQVNDYLDILQTKTNIKFLSMDFQFMRDKTFDMEKMVNIFRNNPEMCEIHLHGLHEILTPNNITILASGLSQLLSLETVDFSSSNLNERQFQILFNSLMEHNRIESFDLHNCHFNRNITDNTTYFLCNFIDLHPSITKYQLSDTNITNDRLRHILNAFKIHNNVKSLNISENLFDNDGIQYIDDFVRTNTSLEYFDCIDSEYDWNGFTEIREIISIYYRTNRKFIFNGYSERFKSDDWFSHRFNGDDEDDY